MITLSLNEILYLVLIVCCLIVTIYLAVTLSRLNSILVDVRKVSQLLSRLADLLDGVGTKIIPAINGLVLVIERAMMSKAESAKASSKKKSV